jgi:CRP-like cAMP-binding protein
MFHAKGGHVGFTNVDLFKDLGRAELGVIWATGIKHRFSASEVIVLGKERASRLFLVGRGCVNYSAVTDDGRKILLGRLGPGDVFGLATFLSKPTCYLGTAKAVVRNTEVYSWDYRMIRQLATTYPRLADNALAIALRALSVHVERHIRLISNSARERVAFVLTRLAVRAGRIDASGVEVDITNEDLASLADVTMFTATRLLSLWERKGILEKSRGRILILSPEKLLAA